MKKYTLKAGEKAYTTGAWIRYEGEGVWSLIGTDDDTFYDGQLVEFNENEPYIETKEELE